ncbi:glycosyltransferase [Aeromicrobium sp.]|nr:glycosyltransferase [Candidatus Saccharibacteria bacterium]
MNKQSIPPTVPSDNTPDRFSFLKGFTSKRLLTLNVVLATIYFLVLAFAFQPGNHLLFYGLIAGEVFHLLQLFGFCYTIWSDKVKQKFDAKFVAPVDIFITVCGEPVDIVRETAEAALAMDYPAFNVYLLNDGYVAKRDNWREVEKLATQLGITCITRQVGGGAKAGNINNALRATKSPYIVVFDADHVPHADFLRKTMGYFTDKKIGFVQTPQFYKNQGVNAVTQAAWDQQALFFGPILRGKNRINSAFMCGTNMVLNRKALDEVGGMCEFNIAEDFLTSLFVHQKKWKSVYVPEVLAEGLAPEDFLSYYKQQYRWTRGSLEVIFKYNPLFRRGMSWAQRFQYLISASYFLSGFIVLFDALLPLLFLFTGITAVNTRTMTLAMIFIPYIFSSLYALQLSSNFTMSFRAISFSISSFMIQIRGVYAVLTNQKTVFAVTSKQQIQGNFLYLVTPHIAYIVLAVAGVVFGLFREGLSASLLANLAWVAVNVAFFVPFIMAAAPARTPRVKRRLATNPAGVSK